MPELTLSEMLRLGGYPAYLSFFFGILIVLLIIKGFVITAPRARRNPRSRLLKMWSWVILIAGLICAFNGGVGTITGLKNVYRAAAAAGADASAVLAQGVFEVTFSIVFGFMFAWLALFGYATVRLAARQ
ncbi:MAG: hypothetical protein JSU81_01275 [Candidatus Coatesbacteria bacterium]|nr:MAG: hypothetical protein JSU81_01275 [Candidatus Coatesbacteria bacterium]